MRSANATKVHRKSGVAKWRDLLFLFRFSHTLLKPLRYFFPGRRMGFKGVEKNRR